ncbi:S-adenosyl-L-methionine-dependent methyltransferase [Hypoxylon rubiginosum]|uniref:S-adenosyl-L-methionine-dependent methyltransferase n=1 Tax=Hypoxylon rubiginosum TaxID=110542 RepID=A0ACB9YVD6_9PEZI|nr:S-adenosyl-L-methionine-dependent methyltransferase [Hypoxylon rubiginosum]
MFLVRSNARHVLSPLFCRQPSPPTRSRTFASEALDATQLQTSSPLAAELAATGLWIPSRKGSQKNNAETSRSSTKAKGKEKGKDKDKDKAKAKGKAKVKGDKARVNIVNEKLCDDIFSYVGSSLDRHKGCDILDIYPGAGLWSRKLHDYLQPRSHILMEPEADFYKPFLKPLLDRPNTTLVPASGLVWRELKSVLTPEYLPHQVPANATRLDQRNDTLLVTANLAFHPKRRFLTFESIAQLVLYQFIESIRTGGLFQRYGLVRMLIWARHDDKFGLLPKVMQKHKKLAIESELSCDWVHEVCGREGTDSVWFVRDDTIDSNSNLATWRRMQAAKLKMPKGRTSEGLKEARLTRLRKPAVPGTTLPIFRRPFQEALGQLETDHEEQIFIKGSANYKRMQAYRWRASWEERKHRRMLDLISDLDAITALYKSGEASPEEIKRLETEWEAKLQDNPRGFIEEFVTYKDNLHYYRQDPPILNWDRRAYDTMAVQPEEFFPNVQCSLLDIQPKAVHPLLRQTGPKSNRAADCFELIMTSMMGHSTLPVSQTLDALMPGAADYIIPRWNSAKDVDRGGVAVNARHAELTPRMLNARQWEELLQLWMEWPFRPEFHELVARTHDELGDQESLLSTD